MSNRSTKRTGLVRERVSPGSMAAWTRKFIAVHRDEPADGAHVPCGTCTVCCRVPSLVINLRPDEVKKFPEAVWDDVIKKPALPRQADGSCIHLVDDKCAIYHRRPWSCRTYDCRRYLVGMAPEASGVQHHAAWALDRWGPWRIETRNDAAALIAWHAAMGATLAMAGQAIFCSAEEFTKALITVFGRFRSAAHSLKTPRTELQANDLIVRRKLKAIFLQMYSDQP